MTGYDPKQVAARVRQLIRVEDGGDEAVAATRLGLSAKLLSDLLAGGLEDANLAVLAAIIRGYRVDATWLLTGESDVTSSHLAPESRLAYADLLSELGREIMSRRGRPITGEEGGFRAIA
jgi:hypothetical protein